MQEAHIFIYMYSRYTQTICFYQEELVESRKVKTSLFCFVALNGLMCNSFN